MCAFEDISNIAQNLYTLRASDYGGNVDFRIDRQAGERAYHCGSLTETLVRDRIQIWPMSPKCAESTRHCWDFKLIR